MRLITLLAAACAINGLSAHAATIRVPANQPTTRREYRSPDDHQCAICHR